MNLTAPVEHTESLPVSTRLRKMVNPATIAILAGVFVVLSGIQLPSVVITALTKTGAAASPLAMELSVWLLEKYNADILNIPDILVFQLTNSNFSDIFR